MKRVLLFLSLLASCQRPKVANLAIDTSLIPAGATALAGFRVDAIRKTPTYKKYAESRQVGRLDQFIKDSGFDPRTGLDEILIASDGKQLLVIARGKFDNVKITQKNGNAIRIVNPNLALAGPEPMINAALARSGKPQPLPARLKPLLEFIPANAQIWTVAGVLPKLNFDDRSNLSNAANILSAIDSMSAWADLTAGLRCAADAHAVDEPGAKHLQIQLKGLIGLGRLSTPDNQPQLLKLFDAIEVKQEGRSLHLAAEFTMELMDALMKQLESLASKIG
jgi:hypothetical protein